MIVQSDIIAIISEGKNLKRWPKQKLSDATKRLIIRKASNKSTSLERLKSGLDLNVSKETIRRVQKNCKTIRFQKLKVKPQHKEQGLHWTTDKMVWAINGKM